MLKNTATTTTNLCPQKRILIYSHDTFGLGNIRRMVSIAESMVAADNAVNVLIVTGSPMLQAFRLSERIDYIKLPCLSRDTSGRYSVKTLDTSWEQIMTMRSRLLLDVVEHFRPHTVVVDKKPLGIDNELQPALESLHTLPTRPRVYLLLRDILDSPENTIPVWAKNDYHAAIERHYANVLVVGQQDIFDLGKSYCFPASTLAKMTYCGFLDKSPARHTAVAITTGKPLLLVTVGGGEDGQCIVANTIRAIKTLPHPRAFRTHVVLGPEMAAADRAAFHREQDAELEIADFESDLPGLMKSASLVVSMAGYNTVCELLAQGKNAILVPRETPVLEQLIRAQALSARGIFSCLERRNATSEALLALIQNKLENRDSRVAAIAKKKIRHIDLKGFDRINEIVLQSTDPWQSGRSPANTNKLADSLQ